MGAGSAPFTSSEVVMSYYDDGMMGDVEILGEDDYDLLGEDIEILGEDDDYDLLGYDDDDDMMGFSLRKLARRALNPASIVTDRLPRKYQRYVDPIGHLTRKKKARRRARKAAAIMAPRRTKNIAVRYQKPTEGRRLYLPVDSVVTVAAAANLSITVQPTQAFRASRFFVDPTVASQFLITDIKVGRKSQLVGGGALPASFFATTEEGGAVHMDTAQTSVGIQVDVNNRSGAPLRFVGGFLGETVSS